MSANRNTVTNILLVVAFVLAPQIASAQTNTFPSSGDVGIGTTTPGAALNVSTGSVLLGATTTNLNQLSCRLIMRVGTNQNLCFERSSNASTASLGVANDANTAFADFQLNANNLLFFGNNAERMRITSTGNIGIGTTNPAVKLHSQLISPNTGIPTGSDMGMFINNSDTTANNYALIGFGNAFPQFQAAIGSVNLGSGANAGGHLVFHTRPAAGATAERMRIDSSGRVGIGTTGPTVKLGVQNSASFTGTTGISATNATADLFNNTPAAIQEGAMLTFSSNYSGGKTSRAAIKGGSEQITANASGFLAFYVNQAAQINTLDEKMRITTAGNIGIGTTAPAYKLDVAGIINSSSGGFRFPDGSVQTTAASGGGGGVPSVFGRTGAVVAAANDYTWAQINKTTSSLADLTTRSANDLSSGTLPDARFPATLPAVSGANLTSLNASNLTSGTVGATRLGSGTPNSTTFLRGDSTWAAITSSQWANGSGNINYTAGNVGVGTTSPTAKLHVSGSGNMQAIVESSTAASELDLVSNAAGSGKWALGTGWASAGSIRNLWFYDNVAAAIRFAIDSSGKVGIGTTSPEEKLHVAGSIKVDGNINAKYQDLAEWVPSSEQPSAGTVVVLDTAKSNQVISSSTAYDTRVAGVISAQPGITLGEGGEGKVLVATTGRVRVKVDASRGPIQIGDLLVTSDTPGVAMKSEAMEFAGRKMHMPGTIIGKALEPLAKGSGEILVLLSLQ